MVLSLTSSSRTPRLSLLLTSLLWVAASYAGGSTHAFDIPAGDAASTLGQFIEQSQIEMTYVPDEVRGVQTNAVQGKLDAPSALDKLLKGTRLKGQFDADGAFAWITLATPSPTQIGSSAWRSAPTDLARIPETELNEVVVTGTMIHGVLDIMSPLQILSHDKIKRSAYATIQSALQDLPFNYQGPSEESSTGGNVHRGVAVNLRGLDAGTTLVLVNGHRQPLSGLQGDFVDVSNIPASIVERIEVLPDGASALYGSDAIAGVVNVVTRKDLDGAETQARYGLAQDGAEEKMYAQLFGWRSSGGSGLLAYQYSERTPLPASARPYAASADKRPYGGSDLRSISSSPGNVLNPWTLIPAFGIVPKEDGSPPSLSDLVPGQINLWNPNGSMQLLPAKSTHSVYALSQATFGDGFRANIDMRVTSRYMHQSSSPVAEMFMVPVTNPFVVNPYPGFPFVTVAYSFENDLGPTLAKADTLTLASSGKVEKAIGETWHVSLVGSYGAERLNYSRHNSLDMTALQTALASPDASTAFDPFGSGGQSSPQTIEAIRSVQHGAARSRIYGGNLVADGTALSLKSGEIKLAVGAEVRSEQLDKGASSRFDRSVSSAFAELSVPVLGSSDHPRRAPRLELSLSGRFEHYSDFGQTANPKIGLRWAPTDTFKFRTTWGTSFRAPKLVDLYDGSQNLATHLVLEDPQSPIGSSVVLAIQGNNPDAKAETATTWSAGFDVLPQFAPGSTLSLTYFSIDYKDRVAVPGPRSPFDILVHEDEWEEIITRDPSSAQLLELCDRMQFFTSGTECAYSGVSAIVDYRVRNIAITHVRGVDLDFRHELPTRFGHFDLGVSGAYVFEFAHALSSRSPLVDVVDTVGNPLSLRLRGEVGWSNTRGFSAAFSVQHAGGYEDTDGDLMRSVNSFTTLDARVGYRTNMRGYLEGIEINAGVANILNRHPPFVNRESGYDLFNADPEGRVISLSVLKSW